MKPRFNADDEIASRRFDSDDGPVALRVHRPLPWPSDQVDREPDYVCWYSIAWPEGQETSRSVAGLDSVQAVLLAFAAALGDLRYMGDGTGRRRSPIRWLDNDDLGLTINHFE